MIIELQNNKFADKYYLSDSILEQRDYRIDDDKTIIDFIISEDINLIDLEEPIVLLSLEGKIFELNLTAALIWENLKLGKNSNEINTLLMQLFDSTISFIEDINDFISILIQLEFLKVN